MGLKLNYISDKDFLLSKNSFPLLQIANFSWEASPPDPPHHSSQHNSTSWIFYLNDSVHFDSKSGIWNPISFPHKMMSFQAIHLIFSSGKFWKSTLSKNEKFSTPQKFFTPSRVRWMSNDQTEILSFVVVMYSKKEVKNF